MKIVITGHTKGLGQFLYSHFLNKGFNVIGFSRSTGHDIIDPNTRNLIVKELEDADIFINNAYNNFDDSQLILLKQAFEFLKGKDKLIINISSRYTQDNSPYCITKKELDIFCQNNEYKLPQIINLKPGLFDSPRVERIQGKKMSFNEMLPIIEFVMLNKNVKIHSITFGKTNN